MAKQVEHEATARPHVPERILKTHQEWQKWRLTNGDYEIELCGTCRQPIYSGHVDCTCDKNHPDRCDRSTYETLFAAHSALVAALEKIVRSRMKFSGQVPSPHDGDAWEKACLQHTAVVRGIAEAALTLAKGTDHE